MFNGIIAIPTEDSAALQGKRSDHFGHSGYFTLVTLEKGQLCEVDTIPNAQHGPGGCGAVVKLLQDRRVNAVIAGGMGKGPYAKLNAAGIKVLFADHHRHPDVQSVVDSLPELLDNPFSERQLCTGNGNCHAHGNIGQHQAG
jgi:predicted Fe-Mo cluster-binding NifX family protein